MCASSSYADRVKEIWRGDLEKITQRFCAETLAVVLQRSCIRILRRDVEGCCTEPEEIWCRNNVAETPEGSCRDLG